MNKTKVDTTNNIDFLRFVFENAKETLENSLGTIQNSAAILEQIGEKDEFAQQVEDVLNNPIDTTSKFVTKHIAFVKALVNMKFVRYFKQHKALLNWVKSYKTGNNKRLFYIISLKDNSDESKDYFFDFLYEHMQKPISDIAHVNIQFAPPEVDLEKFYDCEDLDLSEIESTK